MKKRTNDNLNLLDFIERLQKKCKNGVKIKKLKPAALSTLDGGELYYRNGTAVF